MAGDPHRYLFGHAPSRQVPGDRAAEVVEEPTRAANVPGGDPPGAAEVTFAIRSHNGWTRRGSVLLAVLMSVSSSMTSFNGRSPISSKYSLKPFLGTSVREEPAKIRQSPAEQMTSEVLVAPAGIPARDDRLGGIIEAEPNIVWSTTHGLDGPQELLHLALREQQDLRCPPRTKLAALLRINRRIQRHGATKSACGGQSNVLYQV